MLESRQQNTSLYIIYIKTRSALQYSLKPGIAGAELLARRISKARISKKKKLLSFVIKRQSEVKTDGKASTK